MQWHKGTIQIKIKRPAIVGDFDKTVDAYISGPFAIHRSSSASGAWSLTHIPTKSRIVGSRTMRDAKIAAERFAIFPIDWDNEHMKPTRELYDLARSMRREGFVI